jgi:hypothetical protein
MRSVFEDATLICPANDLESQTIIKVASGHGIDTRISQQKWGGKLGAEPPENLKNLKKTLIVVELPDEAAERWLRSLGHELIIIDHHNYSDLSRFSEYSALEQFCALIDEPLTAEFLKIAYNDRDFIPGLAHLGCSYEEMEDIRQRERKIRGVSELFTTAQQVNREPSARFGDELDIYLVSERYIEVMAEVAQWPTRESYSSGLASGELHLRKCLLLFHKEDDRDHIVQVEYYGEHQIQDALIELLNDKTLSDFNMWMSGGTRTCYWCAKPRVKEMPANLFDKVIDQVLSIVLITEKPLRYFSTRFIFPFRFENGPPTTIRGTHFEASQYEAQEVMYFLPKARSILFGEETQCDTARSVGKVDKWVLPQDQNGKMSVKKAETGETIAVPIKNINLFKFYNGLYFLSVELEIDTQVETWDKRPVWRIITGSALANSENFISPSRALEFNNLARLIYCSYPEQVAQGNIPEKICWGQCSWKPQYSTDINTRYSTVIRGMIEQFAGNSPIDLHFIYDDRMFVHSCITYSGDFPKDTPTRKRYFALFSLAHYVDKVESAGADGFMYDQSFVKEMAAMNTYRRFYDNYGNLFGFTRYSAIYTGFGSFFHKEVTKHVNSMYFDLSLMALFYRFSLLFYQYRLGCFTSFDLSKMGSRKQNAIKKNWP